MTEHGDVRYHLVVRKLIPLCALDDVINGQYCAVYLTNRNKTRKDTTNATATYTTHSSYSNIS